MPGYNWKQFTKRITIKAPPKAIYDAWTTQQGLESWFLRLAEFKTAEGKPRGRSQHIEKGDHYRWLWFGYDDSVAETSEVNATNGWNELLFGFTGGCMVKVSVKQENGENICELVQDMPMEDVDQQQAFYIECGKGWTFYMTNLKSILEGGPDLRNKNADIRAVINS